jgi:CheY-like chemotaxis protein
MNIENVKGLIEALNGDARNAMHSILGFLDLVSEGKLEPAQRNYIEACRMAADRHFRGIEDVSVILGLGPKERSVITHFSLGALFGRVGDAISGMAERKGVRLSLNVDSSVPPVVAADLDRIGPALLRMAEAVVSSLGGADAGRTAPNGSPANASAANGHPHGPDVQLNLRALPARNAADLTFEIVAPARMLPPLLMRALHQPDFEFDASLAGSGALGLVAARNLGAALGGRVEAASDPIKGTRVAIIFRAALPSGSLSQPQPVAEEHSSETAPPYEIQRALRILVAEDSEDNFELFKAYLRGQPHAVERASNGEEAVELASTGAFDLAFMDICMPLLDGYAATRRIRELETGKDRARLPIVVLSAEDLRAQRRQGALAGCSGHLSKPLRKHELLEAIKTYSKQSAVFVC